MWKPTGTQTVVEHSTSKGHGFDSQGIDELKKKKADFECSVKVKDSVKCRLYQE